MRITLDLVRQTLRESLGRESFIASFLSRVEERGDLSSASIDAEGVLRYNPAFTGKHITCAKDLFTLLLHEIMHPMFGHFIHGNGPVENLAADMVINAAITLLYPEPSNRGALFKRLYRPGGLEGLLRPESRMHDGRYGGLYTAFYGSRSGSHLSTGEVIQTLKILSPADEVHKTTLLGSHELPSGEKSGEPPFATFPDALRHRIAEELRRTARFSGGQAGWGENLHEMFLEAVKTHLSLRRTLLETFTTRRKVDRFRQTIHRSASGVSPVPLNPSKRDFILLAADIPPFHYHNRVRRTDQEERGLAVYLDVSGSVNAHLPEIIGLMSSLRSDLSTVFLFSNAVVEVPFKSLLAGCVRTTYGTDFDCIADSLLERNLDKAVILTDGYASLSPQKQDELRKKKLRTLTVLFGGKTDCAEFAPFGDIVRLEDITC